MTQELDTAAPTVLQTNDLSLAYGRDVVVRDLNIQVRSGEIYGFLGRNGAGKTSTIRMLMGIIKPRSGTIELLGEPTRRLSLKQKQRIGYVSQQQYFYNWMTVRRLGVFVGGFYPTWDESEFQRLTQVLDIPLERKVGHLSGGTKVKLALALALAHRPTLLILDEPTAGLDPVARREFLEIIAGQARSAHRTTLFSTHLIDEVERVADRVGILHHGQLQFEGSLDTLKQLVREVTPAAEQELPQQASELGFQILRRGFRHEQAFVLRGEPQHWERAATTFAAWEITELPLEDIFIALATDRTQL